jgi:hypothetical protein
MLSTSYFRLKLDSSLHSIQNTHTCDKGNKYSPRVALRSVNDSLFCSEMCFYQAAQILDRETFVWIYVNLNLGHRKLLIWIMEEGFILNGNNLTCCTL